MTTAAHVSNGPAKGRRTASERHVDNLTKERQRAQESLARAQKLAQEAAAAEAEARRTQERIQQMETAAMNAAKGNSQDVDAAVQGFATDIKAFFDDMKQKYGFHIDYEQPRMVKRGFISGKFKAELKPSLVPLGVRPPAVIAREAGRFMHTYKNLGLEPNLLGQEVTLTGEDSKFVVAGLRGKGNDVVLQKAGTDETYTMAREDFKRSYTAT